MEINTGHKYQDLIYVAEQFKINGTISEISPYGNGHIHKTYLISIIEKNNPGYILQKINHHVFRDVSALMSNITCITNHLNRKLRSDEAQKPKFNYPDVIYTMDGASYYETDADYWRIFEYIPDSFSFQKTRNETQAFEAGKIIGNFQYLLSDVSAEIYETIPRFHDMQFRLEELEQAVKMDCSGRLNFVDREIGFIMELLKEMKPFLNLLEDRKVPYRITHNDTKLDNILFDRHDHAICLLDLDTVMSGYIFYDFGDAIRTISNSANEDERDLAEVRFLKHYYDAFTNGYLQEADTFLTPVEKEWISHSPVYMTLIMGIRFLTDYINGDIYYHTNYSEHNIVRARCQLELIRQMMEEL